MCKYSHSNDDNGELVCALTSAISIEQHILQKNITLHLFLLAIYFYILYLHACCTISIFWDVCDVFVSSKFSRHCEAEKEYQEEGK